MTPRRDSPCYASRQRELKPNEAVGQLARTRMATLAVGIGVPRWRFPQPVCPVLFEPGSSAAQRWTWTVTWARGQVVFHLPDVEFGLAGFVRNQGYFGGVDAGPYHPDTCRSETRASESLSILRSPRP